MRRTNALKKCQELNAKVGDTLVSTQWKEPRTILILEKDAVVYRCGKTVNAMSTVPEDVSKAT